MGREIAAVLPGPVRKGNGFIETGAGTVTWLFGHVLRQAEPQEYDAKYKVWRAEDLPIIPELASKFDTTVSRVERAIRHAIEVSWIRGDINLMEELFGFSVSCDKSKPTNSEFLTTIADRIKLDNKPF